MKPYVSLVGILLVAALAVGAGCAEEEFLLGGGKGKKGDPSSEATPTPTPSPSGSGLGGNVKND